MSEKDHATPTRPSKIRGFVVLLVIVCVIWSLSWYLILIFIPSWQDRSSFGEMFGAVNAFFSGAALAGVIYAIVLQRRELELQRYELEMTRLELRRSAEAQENSEKALTEQAKALAQTAQLNALAFLPTITCKVQPDYEGSVVLSLLNLGDTPAFDVEVLALGYYNEDDSKLSDFIDKFVLKNAEALEGLTSTDERFFGLFDRLCHFVVPQKQMNVVKLSFPIEPLGVYVFLQFRDVRGSNYFQLYWFFGRDYPRTTYALGNISPPAPMFFARIDTLNSELSTEDKSPIPSELNEFVLHLRSSFSSGYVTSDFAGPEDRGEWADI